MVRQHDAAGAHTDVSRAGGDMSDDHGSGCAGNTGHAMVFRQPIPLVTQGFCLLRQFQRSLKRGGGIATLGDGAEVKDRNGHQHDGRMIPVRGDAHGTRRVFMGS